MFRNLPPLNTLRAFEAAARHESFSKAADEISVTHGAVSRAVRQLEDNLGQQLFRRTTRSVTLTATGTIYVQEVRTALDRLLRATLRARAQGTTGALNVSTMDSFAGKWLLPRLYEFRRANPEIDVRLSTSEDLADFVHDDIDIALRYGRGRYPGLETDFLMDEDLTPVCSPALLEGPHGLKRPEDLKHHTFDPRCLLHRLAGLAPGRRRRGHRRDARPFLSIFGSRHSGGGPGRGRRARPQRAL